MDLQSAKIELSDPPHIRLDTMIVEAVVMLVVTYAIYLVFA